jgi:hypothetical protein
MHRSGWITGAIVAQALWAAFLITLAVLLLILTRAASAEVSAGLKAAATFLITDERASESEDILDQSDREIRLFAFESFANASSCDCAYNAPSAPLPLPDRS